MFQLVPWDPRLVAPVALLLIATGAVILVARRSAARHELPLGLVVLTSSGVGGALVVARDSESLPLLLVGASALTLGAAFLIASLGSGRLRSWAFVVLIGVFALLTLHNIRTVDVVIDVQLLLEGGIDALLDGQSPYSITIPNMYNAAGTDRFYGQGVVENGRVIFGYPYLPAPLLLDIPAHLLGDVRWMHLVCVLVAGTLAWRLAKDNVGRAAAALIVVNPISSTILLKFMIEPVMELLLVLAVWAMLRCRPLAGLPLGLFFASKQYAVSYLPALWSVARSAGLRTLVAAGVVGSVVVFAFVLWDPGAFVNSAIEFHLRQPFRVDAMSIPSAWQADVGPVWSRLLTWSPLIGLAVSLVIALRTRPGPTAFALGVGLSLLVTVLLSKQASVNYYGLAGTALLLAVITWREDDPIPGPGA